MVLCLEVAGRVRRGEPPEPVRVVPAANGGAARKVLGAPARERGQASILAQASLDHAPDTTEREPQNSRNDVPVTFHR